MLDKHLTIIKWIIIGIIAIALCSAVYDWYRSKPVTNDVTWAPVPEMKQTVKIKRIKIPGPKQVVTIEKKIVVEKVKLPDEVKNNPNKEVIATATIGPYEGNTDAVAIMDMKEGSTQIVAKRQPLPIVAFENKKEIGVRGGYAIDKEGSAVRGDVYGRWTFFRVGNIHTGVYGEINTKSEGKTMIDVSYRW